MSMIDQQVGRARRRLTTNVFLQRVAFAIIIAGSLWSILVLVERAFVLGIPLGASAIGALVVAAALALAGTLMARVQPIPAAVAIDEAAGLKERLSTALICRRDTDPFAQAAVRDAEKTAGRVHVPAHLPYRAPQLWPWAAAALLVALFIPLLPNMDLLASDQELDPELQRAVAKESQNITIAVNEQMEKLKSMSQHNPDLKGLAQDLDPLELPEEPTTTPDDIRQEAVARIDNVADKLARKADTDEMNALKQMKRMMARLTPQQGNDPVAKLANALATGDMEKAQKSLADLKKSLEDAAKSGDAEAKLKLQQLEKRLDNLSKQISKLADTKDLEKELEKQAGMSPEEAKKLIEKLKNMDPKQLEKALQEQLAKKGMSQEQIKKLAKKMANQQKACKGCKSMAQALAQAAKGCQPGEGEGDAAAAAAALGDAMQQMSEMEMAEQMLDELEMQLAELEDLRENIGEGGFGQNQNDGQPTGTGPRPGKGYGANPKAKAAYDYKASRAKTELHAGEIIGQMMVDGQQVKGEAQAEVRDAVNSAVRDAEDAIERDRVPRQYQRAVKEYFDRLAGYSEPQGKSTDDKQPASGDKPSSK